MSQLLDELRKWRDKGWVRQQILDVLRGHGEIRDRRPFHRLMQIMEVPNHAEQYFWQGLKALRHEKLVETDFVEEEADFKREFYLRVTPEQPSAAAADKQPPAAEAEVPPLNGEWQERIWTLLGELRIFDHDRRARQTLFRELVRRGAGGSPAAEKAFKAQYGDLVKRELVSEAGGPMGINRIWRTDCTEVEVLEVGSPPEPAAPVRPSKPRPVVPPPAASRVHVPAQPRSPRAESLPPAVPRPKTERQVPPAHPALTEISAPQEPAEQPAVPDAPATEKVSQTTGSDSVALMPDPPGYVIPPAPTADLLKLTDERRRIVLQWFADLPDPECKLLGQSPVKMLAPLIGACGSAVTNLVSQIVAEGHLGRVRRGNNPDVWLRQPGLDWLNANSEETPPSHQQTPEPFPVILDQTLSQEAPTAALKQPKTPTKTELRKMALVKVIAAASQQTVNSPARQLNLLLPEDLRFSTLRDLNELTRRAVTEGLLSKSGTFCLRLTAEGADWLKGQGVTIESPSKLVETAEVSKPAETSGSKADARLLALLENLYKEPQRCWFGISGENINAGLPPNLRFGNRVGINVLLRDACAKGLVEQRVGTNNRRAWVKITDLGAAYLLARVPELATEAAVPTAKVEPPVAVPEPAPETTPQTPEAVEEPVTLDDPPPGGLAASAQPADPAEPEVAADESREESAPVLAETAEPSADPAETVAAALVDANLLARLTESLVRQSELEAELVRLTQERDAALVAASRSQQFLAQVHVLEVRLAAAEEQAELRQRLLDRMARQLPQTPREATVVSLPDTGEGIGA